jgi:hypothetical protein
MTASFFVDKKQYIFRSFWDRDECFKMLSLFLRKFKYGITDPDPEDAAVSSVTSATVSSATSGTTTGTVISVDANPDASGNSKRSSTRRSSLPLGTVVSNVTTAEDDGEVDTGALIVVFMGATSLIINLWKL